MAHRDRGEPWQANPLIRQATRRSVTTGRCLRRAFERDNEFELDAGLAPEERRRLGAGRLHDVYPEDAVRGLQGG